MKNHYDTLGLPENAAAEWVEREYLKHVEALQQISNIRDKQRREKLDQLTEARDVLVSPAARAAFDAELSAALAKLHAGLRIRPLVIPLLLLAAVTIAGGSYWQQQENKRQFLEQQERERIAEESRAKERAAAAERRKEMLAAEAISRQQEEEDRLRVAREQREVDMKKDQYVAGKAYVPYVKSPTEVYEERRQGQQDYRDRVLREREERLKRIEADRELSSAQASVERQKQFLERQRYEEDLAARQRELAAKRAEKAGR